MGKGDGEVQQRIEAIRRDREHGASHLAQVAVRTLALAAETCPGHRGLGEHLQEVAQALTSARPAMAPVRTAVARVLEEAQGHLHDPAAVRAAAERVLERLESAAEGAAQRAAHLLPARGTVLTCSYSATVGRACLLAHQQGKSLRVLALSSPQGGIDYGARLAEELRGQGLHAGMVPTLALDDAVGMGHLALVGADRVLPDGSLVNGAPTLQLARAAQGRIPLYVVCDTFKFDDDPQVEPGFDLVTPGLVTAFVTEEGVLPPAQVRSHFSS